MSLARASTPVLVGLAGLSVVLYALAEKSIAPVHAMAYRKKLEAVRLVQQAERVIARSKMARGITVDRKNDPEGFGVIGPQFSLVTTDRGAQSAKMLAAHPNFAAAVIQMMLKAGVGPGDLVAVGMTGSLPGLNLATLAACRAIGAEPITITSVGSSMFGATDPNLTWLDMETVLERAGVWPYRSFAASLGGGGDVGRGLSPTGRQLLADAIERNGVRALEAPSLLEAVHQRMALYDSVARSRGKVVKLYVNVGGGLASLGGSQNGRLIPSGLSRRLAGRTYPNRGVINFYAERGVPVVHLLHVRSLANEFDIIDAGANAVPVGRGPLFIHYRYNLWIVGGAEVLVLAANLFVLRRDLRQRLLGRPHPERTLQT